MALAPSAPVRTAAQAQGAVFGADSIQKHYPRSAIHQGMEGLVVLDVDVGADGVAKAVRVRRSSGYDVLDQAAADMARGAHFTPATIDGKPVEGSVSGISIRFALE